MTPLRQRIIEDQQLRSLTPATKENYIHHVAALARFYQLSPEHLGLEDLRQYELYLLNEKKNWRPRPSTATCPQFKFLYQVTLEMPWSDVHFPVCAAPTPCQ